REGARFDSTLTLGKIDWFMASRDVRRIARLLPPGSKPPKQADDLLSAMGAKQVDALDASDFEGAAIVHDLNEPLPAHLRSRYDAVIDSGTLEHIFNVPAACASIMDALKVGGHF